MPGRLMRTVVVYKKKQTPPPPPPSTLGDASILVGFGLFTWWATSRPTSRFQARYEDMGYDEDEDGPWDQEE